LAVAALLAVLGLLLVAIASTMRWVTAVPSAPDVPGSARVPLKGSALVPSAVPLALVGVAGLVAAAAAGRMARGALRTAAAVLVVLAGLGLAYLALHAATDLPRALAGIEAARQGSATEAVDPNPVRWLAGVAGIVIAGAGAVALMVGRGWPGLAARYDRDPAAPGRPAAPASTWDAIERGDDPTR
jgi:uncharacterized membrane protein (TIGR02234 family)